MENRPRGREQNVTGQGKDIYKRGEGLGTGPVGSHDGHAGRKEAQQSRPAGGVNRPFSGSTGSAGSSGTRAGGGRGSLILIIIAAIVISELY